MGTVIGIMLIWFVIEMLIWVLIAQFVSGWYVFGWFIVAAVIGIMLIKKTAQTLNPMAKQMQSGVIPSSAPSESTITKSMAGGIAGLLLLLPGVLSDVGAVLLLLPFVQKLLAKKAKEYALKNQDKMMAMMAKQMGGNSPFGGMSGFGADGFGSSPFGKGLGGGHIIDGEAKVKTKKQSSANDD